jgi:hypothetical protein
MITESSIDGECEGFDSDRVLNSLMAKNGSRPFTGTNTAIDTGLPFGFGATQAVTTEIEGMDELVPVRRV